MRICQKIVSSSKCREKTVEKVTVRQLFVEACQLKKSNELKLGTFQVIGFLNLDRFFMFLFCGISSPQ